MNPKKYIYPLVWLSACLFIFFTPKLSKDQSHFIGVVGSRAIEVNRSYPSRLSQIFVINGQKVKKGTVLAKLSNPEVNLSISRVKVEIEKLEENSRILYKLNGKKSHLSKLTSLKKELNLYEKQNNDLEVIAQFDGIVQSVNFKVGESIEPYRSIISMLENHPTHIRGYIHEEIFKDIQLGQNVNIYNLNPESKTNVSGEIVSFGSSIVNFPARLLRDPERPIWGREVFIKIKNNSHLVLGEKVYLEKTNIFPPNSKEISKKEDKSESTHL